MKFEAAAGAEIMDVRKDVNERSEGRASEEEA